MLVNGVVDQDINPFCEPVTYKKARDYVKREYDGVLFPVTIVEIVTETERNYNRKMK